MAYDSYANVVSSLFLFSCVISLSLAQNADIKLPLRAVNLGNWLVTEGWMKPSRFDDIPNKDLLVISHQLFTLPSFCSQLL